MVDVYSCGRSCSYIILFQHFDWCTGTEAALKTGVPLVAGICRVVSKDRRPGISPGYCHVGNKKKTEPKELPSHSIHRLLTAYTQWQIQGLDGPSLPSPPPPPHPYLKVWIRHCIHNWQREVLVTALHLACSVCKVEPEYNKG